jgi:NAD(P)H-nitrite reductase large subunit
MVLPYYLAKEIPEKHVLTGNQDYFTERNIEAILGTGVQQVDGAQKTITLSDGTIRAFDSLLIATGSSAQQAPIPGTDLDGVYSFWTLDDAQKVMAKAQGTPSAVLIGAGFIGFIVLNAMAKLNWKLSVVEAENQVLPRMLDTTGAGAVEGWLTARAIAVHTGTQVQAIRRDAGGSLSLSLSSGQNIEADIVIMATGIRPNIAFLSGSGVEVTPEGIPVNDQMQTNIPGIYAAGDVAIGPDILTGRTAVKTAGSAHAIQPTAVDHGRIAGANMAGQEIHYAGSLLLNVLDVVNLHCASFGLWRDEGHEMTSVFNASRPIYRKYVWHADRIVGALFVGPIDDVTMLNDVGMVKGLIQTQQPLGDWAEYVKAHPTDIRRAYVASGAAQVLIGRTLLGAPSRDRAYRVDGKTPPKWDKSANHTPLVSTQSAHYRELNPTPTPGIGKAE